jgi:beta-lactam-binding protein with PASTA domain
MSGSSAQQAIEQSGLNGFENLSWNSPTTSDCAGKVPQDQVYYQDPAAGTMITKNSENVTYYICPG